MRRSEFAIKDKKQIEEILHSISYGTLALAKENKPYSIPVNFVYEDGVIYFHGAKKGRKKEYMLHNSLASFSVVEPFSMIQSYFSSNDGLACPATHFFRSIICDGVVEIVEDYDTKVKALQLLMEKLQSEGSFKHLSEDVYDKMINATEVFRFEIKEMSGKVKLGQHLPKERYEMVLEHLQKRGSALDQVTIQQMKENR
ncbi:pyridoxamine 5'-phosphate oxidase family protein [Sulfurimonas sp.]|uniref:pyridoxamine 5'-phosphate oxidase family protein n=1 Tax=Sulfurimonas sp. TaxID=2022749 RepID=UPI003D0D465B